MDRNEIQKIVTEEFGNSRDPSNDFWKIIENITIRIAERTVRPCVSGERWDLFRKAIRGDSMLMNEWSWVEASDDEDFVVADPEGLLEVYTSLEAGLLFLLAHYAETPEDFRSQWLPDALLNEAGNIDAECGMKEEELKEGGCIILTKDRVDHLADLMSEVVLGILDGDLFTLFYSRIIIALGILKGLRG